jgi:hypothetical protein
MPADKTIKQEAMQRYLSAREALDEVNTAEEWWKKWNPFRGITERKAEMELARAAVSLSDVDADKIKKGDKVVIHALMVYIKNFPRVTFSSEEFPLETAGKLLGKVAPGDQTVLDGLIEMIDTKPLELSVELVNTKRRNAAIALAEAAPVGDQSVIGSLLVRVVKETNFYVAVAATKALGKVAAGDAPAITALIRLLKQEGKLPVKVDWLTRYCAAIALGDAAEPGNQATVDALLKGLQDPEGQVRAASAEALGKLAKQGDSTVITALTKVLGDKNKDVRMFATQVLGKKAKTGDQTVTNALLARLDDTEQMVRESAMGALESVARSEDPALPYTRSINRSGQITNRRAPDALLARTLLSKDGAVE